MAILINFTISSYFRSLAKAFPLIPAKTINKSHPVLAQSKDQWEDIISHLLYITSCPPWPYTFHIFPTSVRCPGCPPLENAIVAIPAPWRHTSVAIKAQTFQFRCGWQMHRKNANDSAPKIYYNDKKNRENGNGPKFISMLSSVLICNVSHFIIMQ